MTNEERVAAREFCMSHNVEISFLHALCESGLLEMITEEENVFIYREQLPDLERWVQFHYEMDINLEGIEAINHLLHKIKTMQQEMNILRNKLGLYE